MISAVVGQLLMPGQMGKYIHSFQKHLETTDLMIFLLNAKPFPGVLITCPGACLYQNSLWVKTYKTLFTVPKLTHFKVRKIPKLGQMPSKVYRGWNERHFEHCSVFCTHPEISLKSQSSDLPYNKHKMPSMGKQLPLVADFIWRLFWSFWLKSFRVKISGQLFTCYVIDSDPPFAYATSWTRTAVLELCDRQRLM